MAECDPPHLPTLPPAFFHPLCPPLPTGINWRPRSLCLGAGTQWGLITEAKPLPTAELVQRGGRQRGLVRTGPSTGRSVDTEAATGQGWPRVAHLFSACSSAQACASDVSAAFESWRSPRVATVQGLSVCSPQHPGQGYGCHTWGSAWLRALPGPPNSGWGPSQAAGPLCCPPTFRPSGWPHSAQRPQGCEPRGACPPTLLGPGNWGRAAPSLRRAGQLHGAAAGGLEGISEGQPPPPPSPRCSPAASPPPGPASRARSIPAPASPPRALTSWALAWILGERAWRWEGVAGKGRPQGSLGALAVGRWVRAEVPAPAPITSLMLGSGRPWGAR